jgi:hypothetical protein
LGLIICLSCGRQRLVSPIKKKNYFCSNCEARHPRLVRREIALVVWADREGVEPELARHQTFAGLKKYAEYRGYKPGWASMKFKELFGRWPNGESNEAAAPAAHELLGWIRRQNAAYGRRMRAKEKPPAAEPEQGSPLMSAEDWDEI